MIEKLLSKKLYEIEMAEAYSTIEIRSPYYGTITHNGKISKKIWNILIKFDINIALRKSYLSRGHIKINDNKVDTNKKSGVYKLNWGYYLEIENCVFRRTSWKFQITQNRDNICKQFGGNNFEWWNRHSKIVHDKSCGQQNRIVNVSVDLETENS